jgi:hypothetical protein
MDAAPYDIEALTFATGREAFDYCDGEHEGCGGDGVAIQVGMQWLAITRKDAEWLEARGERLTYLHKVPLMRGDGDVVCGFTGAGCAPPRRGRP